MSRSDIQLENVLSRDETALLDVFCSTHTGLSSLSGISEFLQKEFQLELVLDEDVVVGFSQDSSNLPGRADALCRPKTEKECAIILRVCHQARIPLTVSGGRSNLTGSATPCGGIIMSTVNLQHPGVHVDFDNNTAIAPVGMVIEDFRELVLQESSGTLYFPVDPTSREEATIGGAIACNASGFTPGETGAMRHWVEALDVLLPNGMKVSAQRGQYVSREGVFTLDFNGESSEFPVPRYTRASVKNAGGPFSAPDGRMDFVDLMVGSEGIFGMATSARLRLKPKPDDMLDIFFSLPREENALKLLLYLNENMHGDLSCLAAFEYFGQSCRSYMDHESRLFDSSDHVGIYLQVPVFQRSLDDAIDEWLEILSAADCSVDDERILIFDNRSDREMFMEARHSLPANALEVVQQRGTFTIMTDTVVPIDMFADFLEYAHDLLSSEQLEYISFGHFGDCHLHFTILPMKEQLERAAEVYSMLVERSLELGGCYSGEHGTGQRKRADFFQSYGRKGVESLRVSKKAVDPDWLLNSLNVIHAE